MTRAGVSNIPLPGVTLALAQYNLQVTNCDIQVRTYVKRLECCSAAASTLKIYLARRSRNFEINGKEITVCIAQTGFGRNGKHGGNTELLI